MIDAGVQVEETVHHIEQQLEHHRTRTFQEEYLAFLKKHGTQFDDLTKNTSGIGAPDHTVPYGTVLFCTLPRHCVPGYDR